MTDHQLEFVEPTDDPHINVLLYGPPKTGKTVGGTSAPGPVLLLNADRPNASRFAHTFHEHEIKEARVRGLDDLAAAIFAIQEGNFESVVVDTVGEVHRIVLEDISGRALSPKIQDYGAVNTHIERFCRSLCELPINVVLTLHENRTKDEDSGGIERLPYTGTNNPALAGKLMAMVDVIGYTGVVTEDGSDPVYLAQLFDGGGRRGGDRFGVLGGARAVNISEWVDLARSTTAPS